MNKLGEHIGSSKLFDFEGIRVWMADQYLFQKAGRPLVFLGVALLAVVFSVAIATKGIVAGILILGGILGIPFMLACMLNLQFGMLFILVLSFCVLGIKRHYESIPLGLLMDVIIAVMFFGLILKQTRERDWSFIKNPISTMVLVWIVFNLIEVLNPGAASRMAWMYTIRSMAGLMIMYYIALYAIKDINVVANIFKVTIGMALVVALYTLKQEYIGLTGFENWWVNVDQERAGLMIQGGKVRKFSFLSDPVVLGIMMAYCSTFLLVFMTGKFRLFHKFLMTGMAVIMLLAMIYTGTRTAYILLPVGVVFYGLITLRKSILALVGIFILMGAVIVIMPTRNPDHHRIKTAFSIFSSDPELRDESFEVRAENQKRIQPYIQSHPLGGGLGSTGAWGKRFSPGTFLSEFPPDSGYMRIAVEQGWLGLLIYCILLFTIMRVGVTNYFKSRDPKIKMYYLACLTFMFIMIIANYPQETITAMPTSFVFFMITAMMVRLKDFDTSLPENVKKSSLNG